MRSAGGGGAPAAQTDRPKHKPLWGRFVWPVIILAVGAAYFFHIDVYPPPDYDEVGFLNIPYRISQYGDLRYPLQIAEGFGSDTVRKYPPILAFLGRGLVHSFAGFSPAQSRAISGLFILASLALAAWLVPARALAARWLMIPAILAAGLAPPVIMAARTMRFEQEILFLGVAASFGLPLLTRLWRGRPLAYAAWFLSGIGAGWAGSSHPYGLVFPAVLGLCLLTKKRAWQEMDGLGFWPRLLAWGAGVAAPAGYTAWVMLQNWEGFAAYTAMMNQVYSVRDDQLQQWFLERAGVLGAWLPAWLAVRLTQLGYSAYFSFLPFAFPGAFKAIFFIELAILAPWAAAASFRAQKGAQVLLLLAWWLVLGFILMSFIYTPNTNYYLYLGFLVPVGFGLLMCSFWERRPLPPYWQRALLALGVVLLICQALLAVQFASGSISQIARRAAAQKPATLDNRFQAVKEMAQALGVESAPGPVYADFGTWIGAGRDHKSLFEVVALAVDPRLEAAGAVLMDRPFMASHMEGFPAPKGGAAGITQRCGRLNELLGRCRLAGLIVEPGSKTGGYLFYSSGRAVDAGPLVAVLEGRNRTSWWRAAPVANGRSADGSGVIRWAGLDPGSYVLYLKHGENWQGGSLIMDLAKTSGPINTKITLDKAQLCLGRPFLVRVAPPQGRLALVAPGKGGPKGLENAAGLWRLKKLEAPPAPLASQAGDKTP